MKATYTRVWIKTFPGFYGTWFEPMSEYMEMDEMYDLSKLPEDKDMWDYFDNSAYEIAVCEEVSKWIDNELQNVFGDVVKTKFCDMDSPQFYNYSNDNLYVDIEVEDEEKFRDLFYKWIDEHHDYVAKRIKDDFTPCSGFIPYYDDDFDTFMSKVELGNDSFDILISYIIEEAYYENLEYTADLMMYECCEARPEYYFNLPEECLIEY